MAATTAYFTVNVVNSASEKFSQYVTTLKQTAFWQTDEDGAVLRYNAWLPSLRLSTPTLNFGPPGTVRIPLKDFQQTVIETFVNRLTNYATVKTNNTQARQIAVGFWMTNLWETPTTSGLTALTCRNIHNLLAQVRPNVIPPILPR